MGTQYTYSPPCGYSQSACVLRDLRRCGREGIDPGIRGQIRWLIAESERVTDLFHLLVGVVIGIVTSAPVGPVNIMTIRHAALRGWREGVVVGSGAVLADALYAGVAIFSISAVTQFIEGHADWIKLAGALLLTGFGLRIMMTHPHIENTEHEGMQGMGRDAAAAFLMTLTNPGAVLGFIAIIGGLGHWRPEPEDHVGNLAMVLGVALGALSWWCMISALVARYSSKIDDAWLERANRIAGILLLIFALTVFADLFLDFI